MNHVLLSRGGDAEYGAFHPLLALIDCTAEEGWPNDLASLLQDADGTTLPHAEAEHRIYRATSLVHEFRHFWDQFGTIAGLSVFQGAMGCLAAFFVAGAALQARGLKWTRPLSVWTKDPSCPDEVVRFYRFAAAYRNASDVFHGRFRPLQVADLLDELHVEVRAKGGQNLDAATLRIIDERSGVVGTILYPFGVDVLLEGSAHAITRTAVGGQLPEELERSLAQRLHVEMSDPEAALRAVRPYMILDLLLTRYMETKGRPAFYRNLVLGVADEVLARVGIKCIVSGRSAVATCPSVAAIFDEVLEELDIETMYSGHVQASEAVISV